MRFESWVLCSIVEHLPQSYTESVSKLYDQRSKFYGSNGFGTHTQFNVEISSKMLGINKQSNDMAEDPVKYMNKVSRITLEKNCS